MSNSEQRRMEFLFGLYEMAGGNPHQPVETALLGKKIKMEEPEISQVGGYLKEEGLIDYFSFGNLNITHKGRKLVEATMAQDYSEKELHVLEKIREMGGTMNLVVYQYLVRELGMPEPEVATFCRGLERQGKIEWDGGDAILMTDAGHKALERQPEPSRADGNVYHTVIHNLQGGAQIGGTGNTQFININPEFDQAISALVELVNSSSLAAQDREELQDEIRKTNQLALREPEAGVLERAKYRLDLIKIGLASADLLIKGQPLIDIIWTYFKHKYQIHS